jgi:hypothetical protein
MNINNFSNFGSQRQKIFPSFEEASSNLIEIATNLHEVKPSFKRTRSFQKMMF